MKEINTSAIIDLVSKLCIDANCYLNKDIDEAFSRSLTVETSPVGKSVIETLIENAQISRDEQVPICQDTGMAVVFVELGIDVRISGGDLEEAINEGVRQR
jgi:fumarate hydratase subunit alpha